MPSGPKAHPGSGGRVYQVAFTKMQLALLIVGAGALLTIFFSLGYVLASRQEDTFARQLRDAPRTTVRLDGGQSSSKASPPAEADFYKGLLKKGGRKEPVLKPLPLPGPEEKPVLPRPAASGAEPGVPRQPFAIQLFSSHNQAEAERVAESLRRKGFPATIQRADLKEKGVWHRVRVGPFPSRSAALQALESIRERTALRGGQVVPL
ncbi:MAG: SPOR domain-containing protein [bacterium]|nr:SPOR domain-containing protein [bacterium]